MPLADHDAAAQAALVHAVAAVLTERSWRLVTAESCTGGGIAARCTDLAGSSLWFDRGFVTYSNAAKQELLGVPQALLEVHGAVSEPVARAMAEGALRRADAQVAVAVTGIAGPGGAVPGKPVGTVWIAWSAAVPGGAAPHTTAHRFQFDGDRADVRAQTVHQALEGVVRAVREA